MEQDIMETTPVETERTKKMWVDPEKLSKGTFLDPYEIDPRINSKPEKDRGMYVQNLLTKIDEQCQKSGLIFTFEVKQGMIHVMSDAAALNKNNQRVRSGLKKVKRAAMKTMAIDRKNLSENDKRKHDRSIEYNAQLVLSIDSARALILPPTIKAKFLPVPEETE